LKLELLVFVVSELLQEAAARTCAGVIGPAAAAYPDVRFCIYHSGYETGVVEAAYD